MKMRATKMPDSPAYAWLDDGVHVGERLTFSDVWRRSTRAASVLRGMGLAGKPVALLFAPDGLDFVVAMWACVAAGAIAVPMYPPDPERAERTIPRFEAIVRDCGCRVVLLSRDISDTMDLVAESLPAAVTELERVTLESAEESPVAWTDPDIGPDSIAFLQYTSGSTGTPKGVMVTHGSLEFNCRAIARTMSIREGTVQLAWLPLYHDMGLVGFVLQGMFSGAATYLSSPANFIRRPETWLMAISETRAQIVCAPNFAFDLCARKVDRAKLPPSLDLSSIGTLANGSEPVRVASIEAFARVFGIRDGAICPVYGLAEATLIVSGVRDGEGIKSSAPDGGGRAVVSCGAGVSGSDHPISIVDPLSRERVPDGSVGEIWVSGPTVAAGYWNRPELSESTFRAKIVGDVSSRPHLRTGDLGFLRGGELYVTGRLKDIVIIRGANHYPQDIERTVESVAGVRPGCSAAFSVESGSGGETLAIVAEIADGREPKEISRAIRARVRSEHGITPFRIALVKRGAICKTSSGKIQRSACRESLSAGTLETVGPIETTADVVSEMMAGAIGCGAGGDADFFELGGDSLAAVRTSASIRDGLGIDIAPSEILRLRRPSAIADGLDAATGDASRGLGEIPRLARPRSKFAASGEQEQMLAACGSGEEYVARAFYVITGAIDVSALARALSNVVRRHEMLRTTFAMEDGRFVQVVHDPDSEPAACARCTVSSAACLNAAEWDMRRECPPGWANPLGPSTPVRFALFGGTNDGCVLGIVAHHACYDGMSLAALSREISEELSGRPPATSRIQYGDYAEFQKEWVQNSPAARDQVEFWRRELRIRDPIEALALPVDRPHGSRGASGRVAVRLENSVVRGLARPGCTTFSAMLAAYAVMLSKLCRQGDVVVGVPHHGRTRRELEGLIGYFVKMLPIRISVSPDDTVGSLIERVQRMEAACSENSDVPLSEILKASGIARNPARNPLFQTIFSVQGFGAPIPDIPGAVVRDAAEVHAEDDNTPKPPRYSHLPPPEPLERAANFELSLVLSIDKKTGAASGELEYDSGLFDAASAAAFARAFEAIAGAMSRSDSRIEDIAAVDEPTWDRLVRLSGQDRLAWPDGRSHLLHDAFESSAELRGGAIAVVGEGREWTYSQVGAMADDLADSLVGIGCRPGTIVGVCMGHCPEYIWSILGILKSGAAFMPLSPSDPPARRAAIAKRAACSVVVFGSRRDGADEIRATAISAPMEPRADRFGLRRILPGNSNVAYVIATSGSTGEPKLVAIPHSAAATFATTFGAKNGFSERSRSLLASSPVFDGSIQAIFCPLSHGGAVVVPGCKLADVGSLHETIAKQRVTHVFLVTSVLSQLCRDFRIPDTVEHLAFGGERITAEAFGAIARACDAKTFLHVYGPTETVVYATSSDVRGRDPNSTTEVDIGRPLEGTHSAYVLDDLMCPVLPGFPGELCIGGPCVALGYVGRPDETDDRFEFVPGGPGRLYRTGDVVRWRQSDEKLVFMGRIDSQIKLRGQRIELGEIESVARSCPGISDALAAVRGDAIVCYVVTDGPTSAVRAECKARLPSYMVPGAVVAVGSWPRLPSGKVDRAALPDPPPPTLREMTPRRESTRTEDAIASAFAATLRIPGVVAPDAGFFELGGDSIKAFEVVSRVAKRGIKISYSDVFSRQTSEEIAKVATRFDASDGGDGGDEAEFGLAPIQKWFLGGAMSPRVPEMYQTIELTLARDVSEVELRRAMESLVRRHAALRHSFRRTAAGEWLQRCRRSAPVSVISMSGRVDPSAREIRRAIDAERGSTVCAALFDRRILVLSAHHLVVDGISWRAIIEDLDGLLSDPPEPPIPATATYREWISVHRDDARCAIGAWDPNRGALVEIDAGVNDEGSCVEHRFRLDPVVTEAISGNVEECLLAALLSALGPKSGRLYVDRETHGREGIPDVSRTVGWFTRIIPSLVESAGSPGKVRVSDAPDVSPAISLNYHGSLDGERTSKTIASVRIPEIEPGNASEVRCHVFDVMGWISDGTLEFSWRYSRNLSTAEGVARISSRFVAELERIAASQSPTRAYPTSGEQDQMIALGEGDASAYLAMLAVAIFGDLNVPAMYSALRAVVARHEAMRTSLRRSGRQFEQVVHPPGDVVSLRVMRGKTSKEAVDAIAREECSEASRSVLSDAPPTRFVLATLGDRYHLLVHATTHAFTDARSREVLARDIGAMYSEALRRSVSAADPCGTPSDVATQLRSKLSAPEMSERARAAGLPELRTTYGEHAARSAEWLRASPEAMAQLDFWRGQFSGCLPTLSIPTDFPRPTTLESRGGTVPVRVRRETVAGMRKACGGCSTFAALLTMYQILLCRAARQDEVVVGIPFHGRDDASLRDLVGYFVKVLPIRTRIPDGATLSSVAAGIAATVIGCIENSRIPITEMIRTIDGKSAADLRDASRSPIFQAFFSLQGHSSEGEIRLEGVECETIAALDGAEGTAKFELSLDLVEDERTGDVSGALEYNSCIFAEATARSFAGAFGRLVESAAESGGSASVGDLSAVSPDVGPVVAEELRMWESCGSRGYSTFDGYLPLGGSLHSRFEENAITAPAKVALAYGPDPDGPKWTYGEVSTLAEEVADSLRRAGIVPGDIVGVSSSHHPRYIWSIIGVLKAGAAFMPMSPDLPPERSRSMVETSGCRAVASDGPRPDGAFGAAAIVPIAEVIPKERKVRQSGSRMDPSGVAYVIATSGSTGIPKLVAVSHRSARLLVDEWSSRCYGGSTRAILSSGISFDQSIEDAFCAMSAGSTLVVPSCHLGDVCAIEETLSRQGITHAFFIPSLLAQYCKRRKIPGCVRRIDCGGEALASDVIRSAADALGSVEIVNSYGPAEATITATATVARTSDGKVPDVMSIGKPLATHSAHVLDGKRRLVPRGFPGELCLGGPCVAIGYVGKPELTAERFFPNPFGSGRMYATGDLARWLPDGTIAFLGRTDFQVKIRGQRIELGEIETVARSCGGVADAAAVVRGGIIVCYVVPTCDAAEVARACRERLPGFMVPSRIVSLAEWPRNRSGKVDRSALPDAPPPISAEPDSGEMSAGESKVADAWSAVLGIPRRDLRRGSNFFELGGHSMSAIALISELRERFGVQVPLSALMRAQTISDVARLVGTPGRDQHIVPARVDSGGPSRVSGEQEQMLLLGASGRIAYSTSSAFRVRGDFNERSLRSSVSLLVRRHEALRTSFSLIGRGFAQRVMPADDPRACHIEDVACDGTGGSAEAAVVRAIRATRFELLDGTTPARFFLARESERLHVVGFAAHHVCYDENSLRIISGDVCAMYESYRSAPKSVEFGAAIPAVRYSDYAEWQRAWLETSREARDDIAFWRSELWTDPAPELVLPANRERPRIPSGRAGSVPVRISAGTVGAISAMARGCTRFAWALALFHATLCRLSGLDDAVVCVPFRGRTARDTDRVVGYFVKVLPVRVKIPPGTTATDLVARTRDALLRCVEHSEVPFVSIVAAAPRGRHQFRALFSSRDTAPDARRTSIGLEFSGAECEWIEGSAPGLGAGGFDVELLLDVPEESGADAIGELCYDPDLFDAATAEKFARAYESTAESVAASEMPDCAAKVISGTAPIARPIPADRGLTERESGLAAMWTTAIGDGTAKIGPGSDFFESGGNSLAAVLLASDVSSRFGIKFTVSDVATHPTLSDMASAVSSGRIASTKPLVACYRGAMPLSFERLRESLESVAEVVVCDDDATGAPGQIGGPVPKIVLGYCSGCPPAVAAAEALGTARPKLVLLSPETEEEIAEVEGAGPRAALDALSFFRYCAMATRDFSGCSARLAATLGAKAPVGMDRFSRGDISSWATALARLGADRWAGIICDAIGRTDADAIGAELERFSTRADRAMTVRHPLPPGTTVIYPSGSGAVEREFDECELIPIPVDHWSLPDCKEVASLLSKLI
jgi:amino acid adenylation domain-containing protein